jgi:hypothetical protein
MQQLLLVVVEVAPDKPPTLVRHNTALIAASANSLQMSSEEQRVH